jgi:hypothetical protein
MVTATVFFLIAAIVGHGDYVIAQSEPGRSSSP